MYSNNTIITKYFTVLLYHVFITYTYFLSVLSWTHQSKKYDFPNLRMHHLLFSTPHPLTHTYLLLHSIYVGLHVDHWPVEEGGQQASEQHFVSRPCAHVAVHELSAGDEHRGAAHQLQLLRRVALLVHLGVAAVPDLTDEFCGERGQILPGPSASAPPPVTRVRG